MDSLATNDKHGKNPGIYVKKSVAFCSYGGSDQSPGLGENGRISHDFTTKNEELAEKKKEPSRNRI